MNRKETAAILSYLMADFDAPVRPEKVQVWYDALKHIPPNLAMVAAKLVLQSKTYGAPKLQDFRGALARIRRIRQPSLTADCAWRMVTDLIRRYAATNAKEAIAGLPENVRLAAETVGWRELRYGDNPMANRAHFLKAFESNQARDDERKAMPPELLKIIQSTKEMVTYEQRSEGQEDAGCPRDTGQQR